MGSEEAARGIGMAIVERNGNYYAVVRVDGVQRWLSCGTSKRRAQVLHDEFTVKARRGELHIPKPITFREFADLFIMDYAKVALKPVTVKEYEGYLRKYLVPAFGDKKMTAIQPEHVQKYVSRLVREGRLSPKSIRNQMIPFRRIFTIAMQWGYASSNPVKGIALPRKERNEIAFLTPEQMRRLMEATDTQWKGLIALGCMCGMRKGECLGLTWDNVLWAEHRINVRQSMWNGELQEPKTPRSVAKIPMPKAVEDFLLERMTLSPASEMNLVFCRDDGSPLRADWVNRGVLTPALKKAGLPHVTFHGLRHSFVAAHLAAGTPMKVIQELARHSSIQVSMDMYGHLTPETKEDAARRLEEAVWGERA